MEENEFNSQHANQLSTAMQNHTAQPTAKLTLLGKGFCTWKTRSPEAARADVNTADMRS